MMYLAIPVALVLMGFYYWNYMKKAKAAGGAMALYEKSIRKQFGFEEDENMLGHWEAQYYLGPLRADYSPSTAKKVIASVVFNTEYVGEMRKFAISDRGRISIAEPSKNQTGEAAALLKAHSYDNMFAFSPMAILPKQSIRVRDAADVFGSHPEWPKAAKEIASMAKTSMRQPKAYSLVQVEFKDGTPAWTMWLETAGAQRLIAETQAAAS